jgi:hypothetical protein
MIEPTIVGYLERFSTEKKTVIVGTLENTFRPEQLAIFEKKDEF